MYHETMTPKERWLAVLQRKKPDRIPMDYWGTTEASDKLMRHLGVSNMDEVFHKLYIDAPCMVGPRYIGPALHKDTDIYGGRYADIPYKGGFYRECVVHPLADYETIEEIEANYTWPTTDWFDYSVIKDQVVGMEHRLIRGGGSEPFLTYAMLRGDEQAFMDLILNPEMVHYCLNKLFDFAYEDTARIYETIPGKVNLSYVSEDLGSEMSLLMSLDHIREFLLPRMKRMMDLVHSAGAYVFTHSDGAVKPVVPLFIEIGTDVLNPIQWNCPGMEREGLKRDFGGKLSFHGGVDNQYTLAFGDTEAVRQEVRENIDIFGDEYILAPCHNIQAVSPPENVVAMYEEGYRYGFR